MWSYYGSKSKIVDLYPPPVYGKIIEPFAGTARYALKHFDRDVLLVEKNPTIARLWLYLQQATPKEIMALPEPNYKQSVDDFKLTPEEKTLLGFMVAQGIASPQKIVQKFNSIHRDKKNVASSLHKIRHWKIILGDYRDLANEQATWFIDPPYQFGGEYYRMSNKAINFGELAEWCKTRNGQAIVCENTKADWLPFLPMRKMRGSKYTTTEAIWSNMPTAWDMQQLAF